MKRCALLLLLLQLLPFPSYAHRAFVADGIPADEKVVAGDSTFAIALLNDPNVALLVINTEEDEEPYCETINAPDGLWGISIINETKVPGRLCLSLDGLCYYDSGDFVEDNSGMTVKIRGNTSAIYAKKPYKIKLQAKADLLARGNDEHYAHKDWLLIYTDGMSMKTLMGFWVNELMGLQWTPACRFVNVVMNGKYRGLYLLTEAVERGRCRLNVNKRSGYILECDAYWWKEDVYAESGISRYVNYTFKHPDADEITPEALQYIQSEVAQLESSLEEGTYAQYMDVESFASWLLAHDLLGTWDSGGSNIFLTKYDDTPQSKFMMANLWDFDSIERCVDGWGRIHYDGNPFFYPRLFNSPDKTFTRTYVEKWGKVGEQVVKDMVARIDSLLKEPLLTSLEHFRPIDEKVNIAADKTPVIDILQKHKEWFESRLTWMNTAVWNLSQTVGVKNAEVSERDDKNAYDLSGRRVDQSYKGMVLQGGRIYLRR